MSNENNESGPLEEIERKLAGFAPAPARIERDRLMFLAGQAAWQPRVSAPANRFWQFASGVLGATAAALALALVLRGEPREVLVYRDGPAPGRTIVAAPHLSGPLEEGFHVAPVVATRPAVSRVPVENYLRTREVALRMGLDAIGLQTGNPAFSAPPTYGDLLLGLVESRQAEGTAPRHENLSNM